MHGNMLAKMQLELYVHHAKPWREGLMSGSKIASEMDSTQMCSAYHMMTSIPMMFVHLKLDWLAWWTIKSGALMGIQSIDSTRNYGTRIEPTCFLPRRIQSSLGA
jgi:hypothetical protein